MKALGVYTSLLLVWGCFGEVDEHMESSLVKKLTATCNKDGIKVSVRFNHPFTGIVYSYGKPLYVLHGATHLLHTET
ncbi:unnamed protein product [Orchesella dallaii]|uniref:Uncharacterized protein n=1 Tax=Orchesella dallaii TaxID=48710 RepID=A0ABP1PYL8_9HEXA